MNTLAYRPSGLLHWLAPKLNMQSSALLACVGTEVRSLTAWKALKAASMISVAKFIRVTAHQRTRHDQKAADMYNARVQELTAAHGNPNDITELQLLVRFGDIVSFADEFLDGVGQSVAIDISALPKRFFFPIVRRVLDRQPPIATVVALYTRPAQYPSGPLAEDPEEWDHLPLFAGNAGYKQDSPESLVIGVGFEPLGLQAHVEQGDLPVRLLLPFPAPARAYRRSWELARLLQKNRRTEHVRLYRTDPFDPSDTFDRLISLTSGGQRRTLLAPYGPKPMSLGMALFARLTETPVYYTQPIVYRPDYSEGVAQSDGHPTTLMYVLRLAGRDLYALPS